MEDSFIHIAKPKAFFDITSWKQLMVPQRWPQGPPRVPGSAQGPPLRQGSQWNSSGTTGGRCSPLSIHPRTASRYRRSSTARTSAGRWKTSLGTAHAIPSRIPRRERRFATFRQGNIKGTEDEGFHFLDICDACFIFSGNQPSDVCFKMRTMAHNCLILAENV